MTMIAALCRLPRIGSRSFLELVRAGSLCNMASFEDGGTLPLPLAAAATQHLRRLVCRDEDEHGRGVGMMMMMVMTMVVVDGDDAAVLMMVMLMLMLMIMSHRCLSSTACQGRHRGTRCPVVRRRSTVGSTTPAAATAGIHRAMAPTTPYSARTSSQRPR
jgi:hypothetical protein